MSDSPVSQVMPARVTAENTSALLAQYDRLLGGVRLLRIDCAPLVQFDSSVLALLLALRRRALAAGKQIEVLNASANLRKLAGLYGIDELLPMSDASVPAVQP